MIPVAPARPVSPTPDGKFACTLCGKCCSTLLESEGAPHWPASFDRLAALGYYGLSTERGLQVWSWERRAMDRAAERRGTPIRWVPSMVLADDKSQRLVAIVYEEAHMVCPLVDAGPFPDTLVCGAYDARPLVCRAYPVVLRGGEGAYSSKCPDAFLPAGPGREGYHETYGDAFEAAEFGNAMTREVGKLLSFLETAGAARWARGLTREQVAMRLARAEPVDFWDFLADVGAVDRDAWWERALGREGAGFTPRP